MVCDDRSPILGNASITKDSSGDEGECLLMLVFVLQALNRFVYRKEHQFLFFRDSFSVLKDALQD